MSLEYLSIVGIIGLLVRIAAFIRISILESSDFSSESLSSEPLCHRWNHRTSRQNPAFIRAALFCHWNHRTSHRVLSSEPLLPSLESSDFSSLITAFIRAALAVVGIIRLLIRSLSMSRSCHHWNHRTISPVLLSLEPLLPSLESSDSSDVLLSLEPFPSLESSGLLIGIVISSELPFHRCWWLPAQGSALWLLFQWHTNLGTRVWAGPGN
jgi:hypothetical protein